MCVCVCVCVSVIGGKAIGDTKKLNVLSNVKFTDKQDRLHKIYLRIELGGLKGGKTPR